MEDGWGYFWRLCILRKSCRVNRQLKIRIWVKSSHMKEIYFQTPLGENSGEEWVFKFLLEDEEKGWPYLLYQVYIHENFYKKWSSSWKKNISVYASSGGFSIFYPEGSAFFVFLNVFQVLLFVMNYGQEVKIRELRPEFKFVKVGYALTITYIYNH